MITRFTASRGSRSCWRWFSSPGSATPRFPHTFGVDDVVERVLIVAQVFLVAVTAAKRPMRLAAAMLQGSAPHTAAFVQSSPCNMRALHGCPNPRPLVRRRIGGLCVAVVV